MRRWLLFAWLLSGIWLAASCEASEAGSLELVFLWPDGAPDFADPSLPWTGFRDTGRGASLSPYGLLALTKRKSTHFRTAP